VSSGLHCYFFYNATTSPTVWLTDGTVYLSVINSNDLTAFKNGLDHVRNKSMRFFVN